MQDGCKTDSFTKQRNQITLGLSVPSPDSPTYANDSYRKFGNLPISMLITEQFKTLNNKRIAKSKRTSIRNNMELLTTDNPRITKQ